MRVCFYVGDGLGNIAHALSAVAAIRATGHDLTVSVISTVPQAEWLVDHDKVVTGVQDHAGYDAVWTSPTLPWLHVNGKRVLPGDVQVPPLSLQEWSECDACFWIARTLGFEGDAPEPAIRRPEPSSLPKPYIAIAPGFKRAQGNPWKHKAYPHWQDVAHLFIDKSIKAVFVGSAAESEPWMAENGTDLCGKTSLPEMAGVLAGASAVLGVDNGPTAISAAYGTPTVILWGPTSMLKNHKEGPWVLNLAHPACACRPCQFTNRMLECPANRCLSDIPSVAVIRAAVHVLGQQRGAAAESPKPVSVAAGDDTMPADLNGVPPTIVIGCGRSGTNMALEMLRASGHFRASDMPEDKTVISMPTLPGGYLTKVDTYYFVGEELKAFLDRVPEARIVWTWRDPRDMVISKMRRGAPVELGGDCQGWAGDAMPEGCAEDIRRTYDMYRSVLAGPHAGRIYTLKAEDLILDTEQAARRLTAWLGVDYKPEMLRFPEYVRQPLKRARYRTIDPKEVGKWKRWREAYDGWLAQRDAPVESVWGHVADITEELGYEKGESAEPTGADTFISPLWKGHYAELEGVPPQALASNPLLSDIAVFDDATDYVVHAKDYEAEKERILSRFVEHPWFAPLATNTATGTWMHKSSEQYLLQACLLLRKYPDLKGKRILEIGPGFGGLARMLLLTEPKIAEHYLLDHPAMLDFAQEFLKDQPPARFCQLEGPINPRAVAKSLQVIDADLVIVNHCLSETTQAFRDFVRKEILPTAKAVFVIDGDQAHPEFDAWMREALAENGRALIVEDYPAQSESKVYFASGAPTPC